MLNCPFSVLPRSTSASGRGLQTRAFSKGRRIKGVRTWWKVSAKAALWPAGEEQCLSSTRTLGCFSVLLTKLSSSLIFVSQVNSLSIVFTVPL